MKKKAEIKSLKNRVEVLEFKEAAKGKRFVLCAEQYGCHECRQAIKWLSEDGKRVVTENINTTYRNVELNGNYVELRDTRGDLREAYRVKNDALVDMDIEVYRKAFYSEESEKTEEGRPKVTHWQIGDRIRCIKAYEGNEYAVGKEGRIATTKMSKHDGRPLVGVRFDERIDGCHSLDGRVVDRHGWWFADPADYLVKL